MASAAWRLIYEHERWMVTGTVALSMGASGVVWENVSRRALERPLEG